MAGAIAGDAPQDHYLMREFHELAASDREVMEFLASACLDGIWYWDLLRPEHEWMSASFWRTLGYDPATKPHLAAAWQDIINKDDLDLALDNAQRHYVDPTHPYDQLVRYRHAAGHTVWIRCRGLAIRDNVGKPIRMLGAHTDVTSLKAAEVALRARSTELDLILNHVPARIWLKDDRNTIVRCNAEAAASMGVDDADSLTGTNLATLLPTTAKRHLEDDLSVLDGGQPRLGVEERYTRANGEYGWVNTDKIPLHDELGRRRLLVIAADVTSRVEQERRLTQLNASLEDFTHIAAHDLQAPLRQVSMLSQLVREELGEVDGLSAKASEALDYIDAAVTRMRSLIASLHELSRLEATKICLDRCDLNDVLAQARALEESVLSAVSAHMTVD
ncbi:MAG: PAS domain-containing protein, partial [Pseudomonadota bacterium]